MNVQCFENIIKDQINKLLSQNSDISLLNDKRGVYKTDMTTS